jgi:hypothetical protein
VDVNPFLQPVDPATLRVGDVLGRARPPDRRVDARLQGIEVGLSIGNV